MEKKGKTNNVVLFYMLTIALFLLGTSMGNRAVTTISEMIPMPRKHHIVIDAGHGGEDGGAISCTGKHESVFNLQISLRLNDLFHLLGYDTAMVRSTDVAVYKTGETIAQKKVSDLKERVHIVEKTPDAVLLSIHQNTFPESQYSGAQVFYAKTSRSEEWAVQLQNELIQALNPQSHRMAKQGNGIYLLEKIRVPGVLVECGFLSNIAEEAKLCTADYQKHLCCVIAASTVSFLSDA